MTKLFRPKGYFRPANVKEALVLLSKYGGGGALIAGGTDLLVDKNPEVEYIIDMQDLGLNYIKKNGDKIRVGACTTINDIESSPLLQNGVHRILVEAAQWFANRRIRNTATIGGNICSAVPSADMAPPLVALDAEAEIVGPNKERIVPLKDFFVGPRSTLLEGDEILTEILIPKQPPRAASAFLKRYRTLMDIALVNVAIRLALREDRTCADVRIVLGAVAPTPIRAEKAEGLLVGKRINKALIKEASKAASQETKPISDVRASAGYREEMSRVLVERCLWRSLACAEGQGVG